jgi:hypothetical protein
VAGYLARLLHTPTANLHVVHATVDVFGLLDQAAFTFTCYIRRLGFLFLPFPRKNPDKGVTFPQSQYQHGYAYFSNEQDSYSTLLFHVRDHNGGLLERVELLPRPAYGDSLFIFLQACWVVC